MQQRAQDYEKFVDTASSKLATIFEAGSKGANNFRDTFKSAFKDLEHELLSSAIGSAFFGGAGTPLNIGDSLEKSILGAADPSTTASGGAKGAHASDAALQKIANSPTGTASDPLTVKLDPNTVQGLTGSSSGVLPGSPAAALGGSTTGAALAAVLGLGSILGGGGSPSNHPDKTNGAAYGQTIANLTGSGGANGRRTTRTPRRSTPSVGRVDSRALSNCSPTVRPRSLSRPECRPRSTRNTRKCSAFPRLGRAR